MVYTKDSFYDFDKISREEFEEWCDILARYFNYDK